MPVASSSSWPLRARSVRKARRGRPFGSSAELALARRRGSDVSDIRCVGVARGRVELPETDLAVVLKRFTRCGDRGFGGLRSIARALAARRPDPTLAAALAVDLLPRSCK